MADAIRHPGAFKTREASVPSWDWCSVAYYNWWNSSATSSTTVKNNVTYTKTVYDPSPPGYHVPTCYTFNGLTTGSSTFVSVHGLNCKCFTVTNTSNQTVTLYCYALGACGHGSHAGRNYRTNTCYITSCYGNGASSNYGFTSSLASYNIYGGWVRTTTMSLLPVRDY